jgi:RNA polymerase sigma factor (sigma-70 family)
MGIEEFYVSERNNLVNRIKSSGFQEADAEDIVQEATLRALKYKDSFSPEKQDLGAWFNTILVNTSRDYFNANRTGSFRFIEEMYEDTGKTLSEQYEDEEMLSSIKAKINELNEEHSTIVYSHLILGYTLKEIRRLFGINEGNSRVIIHRFREAMKEQNWG